VVGNIGRMPSITVHDTNKERDEIWEAGMAFIIVGDRTLDVPQKPCNDLLVVGCDIVPPFVANLWSILVCNTRFHVGCECVGDQGDVTSV